MSLRDDCFRVVGILSITHYLPPKLEPFPYLNSFQKRQLGRVQSVQTKRSYKMCHLQQVCRVDVTLRRRISKLMGRYYRRVATNNKYGSTTIRFIFSLPVTTLISAATVLTIGRVLRAGENMILSITEV